MKIVQINMVDYGSTGTIMKNISRQLQNQGHDSYTFSMKWKNNKNTKGSTHFYFGFYLENAFHQLMGKIFGSGGLFSIFGTMQLIRKIKKIAPDIIHLHNLHNCYINVPMILKFIKKRRIKCVLTMHDCWLITGKCPHFLYSMCNNWTEKCGHCQSLKDYPASKFDKTKKMLKIKKNLLSDMDVNIVVPSYWLKNILLKSFLSNKPIDVIGNGIDNEIFYRRTINKDHFNLSKDKRIILGVASNWTKQKGIDYFINLSKMLDKTRYQIVLVGNIENKAIIDGSYIINLNKINDPNELANLYSVADVFLNPTLEDTFPTVNMEANACGLPVITFDIGGSPETISKTSGLVIKEFTTECIAISIERICESGSSFAEQCILESKNHYLKNSISNYIKYYERLLVK